MRRRFSSQCAPDAETQRRWRAVLGSRTAGEIRDALKRYDAVGLQAEVPIGPAHMTKGYAVDWIEWLDAYNAKRAARSRIWRTIWLAVAVLVATVAAYLTLRAAGPH